VSKEYTCIISKQKASDLLFVNLDKSFIYRRNSRRPTMECCGTLCLIFAQLQRVLSWCVILYI